MTDDAPQSRGSNLTLDFMVVQERKIGSDLPEGLMDSTGRLVLPLQFYDLQRHIVSGKTTLFLTSKEKDGSARMLLDLP